jgi:REP-associated tyrosine transposase
LVQALTDYPFRGLTPYRPFRGLTPYGGEASLAAAYPCVPRKPRQELEGGIHHVWARGNDRGRVFWDDGDRGIYLAMLGEVTTSQQWRCFAYCLMDNHVHLIVETPDANLGDGMQRLHGLYAQDLNERRGRSGHVFQGRYGVNLITSDQQLWATVAYVARNPVDAGLCERPEDWRWSSHAATIGAERPEWLDVPHLLGYLKAMGGDPRRRYRELVAAATSRSVA